MARDYLAHEDIVGFGWADTEATVERWNEHIAPLLQGATTAEMHADGDEPTVSVGGGRAMLASEWAWNEFCGRGAGDSDELTEQLAGELLAKL